MASVNVNLSCDLQHPVRVQYLDGNMFSMDNGGNTINVLVYDNGEPAQIGGTVTANVIRADGGTVAVTGSLSGNKVTIVMPQACYAVAGAVSVIVKLTQDTTVTTIAAFVANVYRSSTDTVVDPGTIIQSVEDLIADIEGAVADIPVAYNASFAPAYSNSSTYAVGQYVTYDGYLWRCTTAITTAESWTSAHWTKVALASEVSDLKNDLNGSTNQTLNIIKDFRDRVLTNGYTEKYSINSVSSNGYNTTQKLIGVNIPINSQYNIILKDPEACLSGAIALYEIGSDDQATYVTALTTNVAKSLVSTKNIKWFSLYVGSSGVTKTGTIEIYVTYNFTTNSHSVESAVSANKNDILKLKEDVNESTSIVPTWENGTITNGTNVTDTKSRRTAEYIPLNGHDVVFSNSAGAIAIYLSEYDSNKNFLGVSPKYGIGSLSQTYDDCAFVRCVCYSDSISRDTLESYVTIEIINDGSVESRINDLQTDLTNTVNTNNLFAFDLLESITVKYRNPQFEIGASFNNQGNATYIWNNIINRVPINGAVLVRVSDITNATYASPVVVYFYDNTNTVISQLQLSTEKVKRGVVAIPPNNAVTYTVCAYASVTGGLTDTHAIYSNFIVINSSYGETVFNLIGKQEFQVPYYYMQNDYLKNKISTIRQTIEASNGNYDAFVFCTDQHWPLNAQNSPSLIKYISEELNINRLFMGGDYADGINMDALKAFKKAFGRNIYNIVGNHEYMNYFEEDGDKVSQNITEADVWLYLNSGMMDSIVGDSGRQYYYVDNPVQKMRYIILSVYADNGASAISQFEATQKEWFRDTALNLPSGYTAVIFAHYLCNFDYDTGAVTQAINTDISSVVDGYDGDGEIACMIAGHTHIDGTTTTTGGIPVFVTTCDKYLPWINSGTNMEPWLSENRHLGTITEQAFDVVVIDKTNKLISFVRIGAPADNGTGDKLQIRQQYYGT